MIIIQGSFLIPLRVPPEFSVEFPTELPRVWRQMTCLANLRSQGIDRPVCYVYVDFIMLNPLPNNYELRPFNPNVFFTMWFKNASTTVNPMRMTNTWSEFVADLDSLREDSFEKTDTPTFVHARTTDNKRKDVAFLATFAATIDIDEGLFEEAPIHRACDYMDSIGLAYVCQYRKSPPKIPKDDKEVITESHKRDHYKVHITFPFAEPLTIVDNWSADEIKAHNVNLFTTFFAPLGQYDKSVIGAVQPVFAVTRRPKDPPGYEPRFQRVGTGTLGIDYTPGRGSVVKPREKIHIPEDCASPTARILAKELGIGKHNDGWFITCPFNHHDTGDNKTKTLLFHSGKIHCKAAECIEREQHEFLKKMPPELREAVAKAEALANLEIESAKHQFTKLFQTFKSSPLNEYKAEEVAGEVVVTKRETNRVSITDANAVMKAAMEAVKPVQRHATVVKVTTGAGKTRAIAEHLNERCAPVEGERYGQTAVLALPTNKLMREVKERITIPHKSQTGVLSVLNDDGTPACKKHEMASEFQRRGVNIHRMLCHKCEYKKGCAAKEQTTKGEGSLLLTNHTLAPTNVDNLHKMGRHPLIVFDESPSWIDLAKIEFRDIKLLSEQVTLDSRSKFEKNAMKRMARLSVFEGKYLTMVRPVVEFLCEVMAYVEARGLLVTSVGRLFEHFVNLPKNKTSIRAALSAGGVSDYKKEELLSVYIDTFGKVSKKLSTSVSIEDMSELQRETVVSIERTLNPTFAALQTETTVVGSTETKQLALISLTKNARVLKESGGIVLDATASDFVLSILRPDIKRVALDVSDGTPTKRMFLPNKELGRSASKTNTAFVSRALLDAKAVVEADGLQHKIVVFTYKHLLDDKNFTALWPGVDFHYYGNTRGYDHWFQEGYDTFVTVGDPMANIGDLALQFRGLMHGGGTERQLKEFMDATASAELAQAHGRARNPQQTKSPLGKLTHVHVGRLLPEGWVHDNTETVTVSEIIRRSKEAVGANGGLTNGGLTDPVLVNTVISTTTVVENKAVAESGVDYAVSESGSGVDRSGRGSAGSVLCGSDGGVGNRENESGSEIGSGVGADNGSGAENIPDSATTTERVHTPRSSGNGEVPRRGGGGVGVESGSSSDDTSPVVLPGRIPQLGVLSEPKKATGPP